MAELIYKDESYKVVGACMAVYNEKGFGFHEAVYQECLELELGFQSVPFDPQKELSLEYKGHPLEQSYIPDLICFGKIVVELKGNELNGMLLCCSYLLQLQEQNCLLL